MTADQLRNFEELDKKGEENLRNVISSFRAAGRSQKFIDTFVTRTKNRTIAQMQAMGYEINREQLERDFASLARHH
jgi:hypothetical protein